MTLPWPCEPPTPAWPSARGRGFPLRLLPLLRLGLALCLLAPLLGCLKQNVRSQAEEESERDHYALKTIGDITQVGNTDAIAVGGVGVVVGLDGTGGEAAPDGNRKMLEDYLRKKGVTNIKELMTSAQSALVLVSGFIPPGAHKFDTFDIEVKLPPHTRATSLRGGYLKECILYNFEHARTLRPEYTGPAGYLKDHAVAWARGAVVAGVGEGDENARLAQGTVWGGLMS